MRRRATLTNRCYPLLLLLLFSIGGGPAWGAAVAILPVQNRAGDVAGASAIEQALYLRLALEGRLADPEQIRDSLRRFRIRNIDQASPELLAEVGRELEVDWLVTATLHDADRRLIPTLTASLRAYEGNTGESIWSSFAGASGLDTRKLLGRGVISQVEGLAPLVVERLTAELVQAAGRETGSIGNESTPIIAIIPFTSSTAQRATVVAESVTEAARAMLHRRQLEVVSPNRTNDVLRRLQRGKWGGATAQARSALHEALDTDFILTGAVELYDLVGSAFEPEPRLAVDLRLLDARSGRIVWTGNLERRGSEKGGLFGRRRLYSNGALTERVMDLLIEDLLRSGVLTTIRSKESK